MTTEACIAFVDALTPNRVPEDLKRRWLAELEGYILVEIRHHDPEALDIRGETGEELYLSTPFPYDKLYWTYLAAMVDFWHGDLSRYKETADLFYDTLEAYAKWYKRERGC